MAAPCVRVVKALTPKGARRAIDLYRRTMVASIMVCCAVVVGSQDAHDRSIVQLRDGTKVEGRIETFRDGVLTMRVSLVDLRRFRLADIAMIDRELGRSLLPESEVRLARSPAHLLVVAGGSSVRGRLVGVRASEGEGADQSKVYFFRTFDAQERRYEQPDVVRIYLGSYPFGTRATAAPSTPGSKPRSARAH